MNPILKFIQSYKLNQQTEDCVNRIALSLKFPQNCMKIGQWVLWDDKLLGMSEIRYKLESV